jgi:hypothetical protein
MMRLKGESHEQESKHIVVTLYKSGKPPGVELQQYWLPLSAVLWECPLGGISTPTNAADSALMHEGISLEETLVSCV